MSMVTKRMRRPNEVTTARPPCSLGVKKSARATTSPLSGVPMNAQS